MKTVFLIGDGMGDHPCEELDGKTPLQAAEAPNMRKLAAAGTLYWTQTIPEGLAPGSDVANLGLLGYNPAENYTGRAPIEAAGQHLPLKATDTAFRCNLVTVTDGIMRDYSAGHISTEEATQLMASIQNELGSELQKFCPGVQYRHLMLWDNGPADLISNPPHEIPDLPVADHLPQGVGAEEVIALMEASKKVFENHPVNQARIAAGKNPATQIWLWGQGRALHLDTFQNLYGITGTMITAVDLLKGLGVLAGLDAPEIEGATGFVDTNYENKVAASLEAIKEQDFIYVHIEAPDECGHQGDAKLKTQAISDFDSKVVGPIWQEMEKRGEPYRILLTMDHRTPASTKKHSSEPIPLAVVEGPTGPVTDEADFDEFISDENKTTSHEITRALLSKAKA